MMKNLHCFKGSMKLKMNVLKICLKDILAILCLSQDQDNVKILQTANGLINYLFAIKPKRGLTL